MDEACKLPVCEYQLNSFCPAILGSELEDHFELFVRDHSLEKALAAASSSESGSSCHGDSLRAGCRLRLLRRASAS